MRSAPLTTKLIGDRFVLARKIVNYLLDPSHPDGGPKARFFIGFGFSARDPEVLIDALSVHPDDNSVVSVVEGDYGTTTVVQCNMRTPDGRDPCIKTVWMLDTGSSTHWLVTAYPAR